MATALLPHTGTCQVGGEIVLTAENSSSYIIEVKGVEKISNTIDPGHTTSQTQFRKLLVLVQEPNRVFTVLGSFP